MAFEDGSTTSYALLNAQERGLLFVSPGLDVYKGQIVGIHQRPGDLAINVCKKKAATNVRSNKETTGETSSALSTSMMFFARKTYYLLYEENLGTTSSLFRKTIQLNYYKKQAIVVINFGTGKTRKIILY